MEILYTVVIRPIEYLMDAMTYKLWNIYASVPVVLMYLSLIVSTVTLPLYLSADKVQQQERCKQKRMEAHVRQIRSAFKGDEGSMMLFRYYRMEGYHPAYALRGLMPLVIQVPFFIVAYHYIKGLSILNGVSFMDISDLAYPDGLISLAGIKINILPVIMTVVNWISTAVYSRELGIREKIQAYGLSLIFLILLYNSPSGLVVYWICNNVFSLCKNLYKEQIKNKKLFAVIVLLLPVLHYVFNELVIMGRMNMISGNGYFLLLLSAPLIIYVMWHVGPVRKKLGSFAGKMPDPAGAGYIIIVLMLAMAVLYGLVIPSAVAAAAPEEFVGAVGSTDAMGYVLNTFFVYIGLFVIWGVLVAFLAGKSGRIVMAGVLSGWLFASVINYIFFSRMYGTVNVDLKYAHPVSDSIPVKLLNMLIVCAVFAAAFYFCIRRFRWFYGLIMVILLGSVAISVYQIRTFTAVKTEAIDVTTDALGIRSRIKIDRNGKNVLFFMTDRAIASYLPYILAEKPGLKESFEGFTYYPDTLSFGGKTIYASPAVFGGYEYMPDAINARTDKNLRNKQNEALLLMPVMLGETGYKVTVFDPPYANYSAMGDLSIYDPYPYVDAENILDEYADDEIVRSGIKEQRMRSFVFYSMFRTSLRITAEDLYDRGNYMALSSAVKDIDITFVNQYRALQALKDITVITDDGRPGFLMMSNLTSHEPCNLQMPDYEPAGVVDNSGYDMEKRIDSKGNILDLGNTIYVQSYSVNMAALKALAEYFDYLKEEGVYDNTRIIIVADHGFELFQRKELIGLDGKLDVMRYNPLFMVKDFNAKGFSVSDEFMTNADAPLLTLAGLVDEMVNPFTGERLDDAAKQGELYVISYPDNRWEAMSGDDIVLNTGDTPWYAVHDSVLDVDNWSIREERGEEGH